MAALPRTIRLAGVSNLATNTDPSEIALTIESMCQPEIQYIQAERLSDVILKLCGKLKLSESLNRETELKNQTTTLVYINSKFRLTACLTKLV